MIKLNVDEKEILVEEGISVLEACLRNGIYVPNLCFLQGDAKHPQASCRLCFVELQGTGQPVTSCTETVREGMRVSTGTPAVRDLQRSALKLLLSMHLVECARCPANRKCALQQIARFLRVGLKVSILPDLESLEADARHPVFDYHPYRCVLCGRCVLACQRKNDRPLLTFAERGLRTRVVSLADPHSSSTSCENCLACIGVCPVAALTLKSDPSKPPGLETPALGPSAGCQSA
jgi:bidirectional [NiFe] hydrogenase diaphorase subunit